MPVNILVADDSVTMRRIFELTFAGEDAKVTCVESGDAAIAKASELSPDLVLVDATMPTDGYRVASAIKATAGLERTAVIVIASQKSPYDEARGKASGVDDHVVKPFDTQQLIDKLKRVLAQPRAAAPRGAAAPAPAARTAAAPAAAAAAANMSRGGTIAFERAPAMPQASQGGAVATAANPQAQRAAAAPARPAHASTGQAGPTAPAPAVPAAAAAAIASGGELAKKLDRLGLSAEQIEGVLSLSREVVEKVVWEVVPELAETMIREEIRRLTQ